MAHQQQTAPPPPVVLPPFWSNNPEGWFLFVENTFECSRITTNREKFQHAVKGLPQEVVSDVLDLLRDASRLLTPYDDLKSRVLGRHGKTEMQLLRKLIVDGIDLADRRPSAMMDEMLACLPPGEPFGKVMHAHFVFRLPAYIQTQLHGYDTSTAKQLATAADAIFNTAAHAAVPPVAQANAVFSSKQRQPSYDRASRRGGDSRSRSRSRDHRRSPERRRDATPHSKRDPNPICRVHLRYGKKAKNCHPPSIFRDQSDRADQGNGRAARRKN